jgi:ferredoxin-NADP reductase/MOSC domain-containing protein YiiM
VPKTAAILEKIVFMLRLISVNVGLPREIKWRGQTVYTAVWKAPAPGRCVVRRLNIDGDGQGDLAGHGGEHRAVMVYQMDSYRYWESYLGRANFSYGQFGENFTVEGLPDNEVCVGDRYRIGSAMFEVTQPRVTCYRVGIRMEEPQMAALLVSHHRPGFYFRVLEEGEIGAGDEIVKVADGAEHMTIADIDALLYLPKHSVEQLQRSLRIPALSSGWKASFQALLAQESAAPGTGNSGLTASAGPPPAWPGFRPLRVTRVDRESASVMSLSLASTDGSPLPAALPGQFLVLRLRPDPQGAPVLRNYSMSGKPGAETFRISVKEEVNGLASTFIHNQVHAGDILEVSAPRGSFTLRPADVPVVLLSAGIGATPVLAMLYELAGTAGSAPPPEIWWLYGARNRDNHPFAQESRGLLKALPRSHTYVAYSRPGPGDRLGEDYDGPGHLSVPLIQQLGVPPEADFYLCGPASFLSGMTASLKEWGVQRIHTEVFGPEPSVTPGIAGAPKGSPHPPAGVIGSGPQVSFTRSGLTVPWGPGFQSLLELAEACDVPVKWACRTGVCHTCECALIDGALDYMPDPLEPPAAGNALICCSQPRTDLEIDL